MQKTVTIGFIGAGNMAHALVSGLLGNKFLAKNIRLSDKDEILLSQRQEEFGVEIFTDNTQLTAQCEVIILAVKPQMLSNICKEIQAHIEHKPLIISIVAGAKSDDINRWLGRNVPIIRTMPNTPALLGNGATGIVANKMVNKQQKDLAEQIFNVVGQCCWVANEEMLDAVTALSGSGPAYFFLMIESMSNAGIALGLDKETAEKLSIQTALGASMMANQDQESARQLRNKVTSKNGTTQAAIESFQEQNFESIVSRAMRVAFDRAREIGFELGADE